MATRRRLTRDERRRTLIDVSAALFAANVYDDVLMEDVAEHAGVSRALLYRHFPAKRDLFAAVYEHAAEQLIAATELDDVRPLDEQVAAGLDAHIDYFIAHRNTVLAANRVLAGDPTIQAIISDELAVIRTRLVDAIDIDRPEAISALLMSWLVFVRVLCVDWLENEPTSRVELRDMCLGALQGALGAAAPTSLAQTGEHVPGDLLDLRVAPGEAVRPVGRSRRDHRRARVVRVRAEHRVAVADAFHRLGLTRAEHA